MFNFNQKTFRERPSSGGATEFELPARRDRIARFLCTPQASLHNSQMQFTPRQTEKQRNKQRERERIDAEMSASPSLLPRGSSRLAAGRVKRGIVNVCRRNSSAASSARETHFPKTRMHPEGRGSGRDGDDDQCLAASSCPLGKSQRETGRQRDREREREREREGGERAEDYRWLVNRSRRTSLWYWPVGQGLAFMATRRL